MDVAKYQGLASLPGFPFEVRTSASTREQAGRLADRCVRAYSYLGDMLAFRPRCALVVLNRADWSERASNPLYGMPYYSAGNLFLAGEPSDLVARLEKVAGSAPPAAAQELDQVYGTGAGRLVPFADLLVVHELAHAFHEGVPFVFPRSWLMELFANMALYAFVVASEPGRSLHLETLPRVSSLTDRRGTSHPACRCSLTHRTASPANGPARAGVRVREVAMISGAMRRIAMVGALLTVAGSATTAAAVSASGASQPQQRQIAVTTLSGFKVVLTITRGSGQPPMGTVTAAGYRRVGTQWQLISRKRIGEANGWFWFSTDTCALNTTQLKSATPTIRVDSITVRLLITPALGCSGPISKRWQP